MLLTDYNLTEVVLKHFLLYLLCFHFYYLSGQIFFDVKKDVEIIYT